MELLLLLLAVPILWFALWPARVAGRIRRHPLAGAGLLAAVVVAGWFAYWTFLAAPPPADYATGDAELRAMLK